jgi:hypothetical protein
VSRRDVVASLAENLQSIAARGSLDELRARAVERAASFEWSTKFEALRSVTSMMGSHPGVGVLR